MVIMKRGRLVELVMGLSRGLVVSLRNKTESGFNDTLFPRLRSRIVVEAVVQ